MICRSCAMAADMRAYSLHCDDECDCQHKEVKIHQVTLGFTLRTRTCHRCGKAVQVTKNGKLRQHKTGPKEFKCPGSGM